MNINIYIIPSPYSRIYKKGKTEKNKKNFEYENEDALQLHKFYGAFNKKCSKQNL